jgi:hypothetical protein
MIERRAVMCIRRASSLLIVVLAIAVCPACDDGETTAIGPTVANAPFVNRSVFAESPSVQAVRVPGATCPDPLFVAPFGLVVQGDSRSDLFVTEMQMQFVDRTGIRSPERTITREGLQNRFGSTRVAASESRRFPLEFSLGCVGVPQGTLTVGIGLVDSDQRERRTTVAMGIR